MALAGAAAVADVFTGRADVTGADFVAHNP